MTIADEREEPVMTGWEQAFDDAERAAEAAIEAAQALVSETKKMQKAARVGQIAGIRRSRGALDAALADLRQAVAEAVDAWPFAEDDEERYLEGDYAGELRRTARECGLEIHERDGQLISHPSIVRILPGARAVRVDRKKVSTLRPSHLAGLLLENQKKRSRYNSDRFLEALHTAYSVVCGERTGDMDRGQGPVVKLARIYDVLVLRPGSRREYDKTDFARDLYVLQAHGPHRTRTGARVSFHGTRSASFTFVGPDGQVVNYYGIRFTEAA
ncbi:MAG: hypothetical protein J4F37_10135 [Acidobacteria bacterium]|nr:hypothetical protein [Acidobacteriota bacterium]